MAQPQPSRFIGYYNHHPFPVNFTLPNGRSAPVNLEPGEPIVSAKNGRLVEVGVPELEAEVNMGTIARIPASHKDFVDFNRKADQRRGLTFGRTSSDASFQPERGEAPAPRQEHVADVSAAHTTTEGDQDAAPFEPIDATQLGTNAIDLDELSRAKNAPDFESWFAEAKQTGLLTQKSNGVITYNNEEFRGKGALKKYMEASRNQLATA